MTNQMSQNNQPPKKTGFDLSPRAWTGLAVGLIVVLFLSLNIVSNLGLRGARMDLTENGLFSLSKGTVNTLRSLDEPIRIRFFYSETLGVDYPQIRAHADRVRDMLEEYEARAGGKIDLEIIDPEPFTEEEDLANAFGLRGAQTQDGEVLYFGLVGTNAIDGQEVIPFFPQDRQRFLEYDLTELIYRLNTPKKPVLGLLSGLPLQSGPGGPLAMMQGQSRPFLIYEQLQERFEIESLTAESLTSIPETVDVLMIVHPDPLSDEALYAIDQFALRGGRVLAFLDPHSELSAQPGPMGRPNPDATQQSDLGPLLEAWGVRYETDKVVGDRPFAQRVATSLGGRQAPVSYPVWLGLTGPALSGDDLVTADIKQLNLGTAGMLSPVEGAQTTFVPLLETSPDSMLYDRMAVMGQPDPAGLLRQFAPTPERYTLAARITGPLKTAFPDGRPAITQATDEEEGDEPKPEPAAHLAASDGPANLIVVADSDLFDDRFWVVEQNLLGQRVAVPTADNANFVVNAVDNLMGSNDLISLRSRASGERPFTVVDDLRRKAENRYLEQEQALRAQLEEAEERLAALQGQRDEAGAPRGALLSDEEQQLVEQVRARIIATRKELRDVQRSLRSEIESLGTWLAFFNIAFVPLLVAGAAIGLAWWRRKRRAQTA